MTGTDAFRSAQKSASAGPYTGKRLFDLLVVAVVGPPALLVVGCCGAAIKLTSKGPVLFCQERVGWRGETFRLFKLRTMTHDPRGNPLFPEPGRITACGRWLRRLSLDELPQLWNVARGDMSIVGPRPTLAYQVARYTDCQRQRLAVRPGITGLAQVRGRNAMSWEDRIKLDLEYIERQSAWLDLCILSWTVGAVVTGEGVSGHPVDDPLARVIG